MNIEHFKRFDGTPFKISVSTVKNSPGTWNSTKVSIYRDEFLIGEYLRNYYNYSLETFCPFIATDGNWYALYSADYTATRVMKLNVDSLEDWCGEEPSSIGFCPVDFFVPRFTVNKNTVKYDNTTKEYEYIVTNTEYKSDLEYENDKDSSTISEHYCEFAFMSGCVWGDDSSWKLKYIDLSRVHERQLDISERYGYWVLPYNMSLRQCVNMSGWEPGYKSICLTRAEMVEVGK